jgi:hypothetical protein
MLVVGIWTHSFLNHPQKRVPHVCKRMSVQLQNDGGGNVQNDGGAE